MDVFKLTPNSVKLMRPSLGEFVKGGRQEFLALADKVLGLVQQGKLKVRWSDVVVAACSSLELNN